MKEKFDIVLQKDEEIKWCNKTDIFSNLLSVIIASVFLGLCIWGLNLFGNKFGNLPPLYIGYIIVIIIILIYIKYIVDAMTTCIAITNKRIIKRTGAFTKNFVYYSLKNIGTIEIQGTIFAFNKSATLSIILKNFHIDNNINNNGNSIQNKLVIPLLRDAYVAYNILSELTYGNNENLRVKIEK